MEKPIKKHHGEPTYAFDDIETWINHKTGKNLRRWNDVDGQNFIEWVWNATDTVRNYVLVDLYTSELHPDWVNEIITIIGEEFPDSRAEDEFMQCWVDW